MRDKVDKDEKKSPTEYIFSGMQIFVISKTIFETSLLLNSNNMKKIKSP